MKIDLRFNTRRNAVKSHHHFNQSTLKAFIAAEEICRRVLSTLEPFYDYPYRMLSCVSQIYIFSDSINRNAP